MIGNKEIVVKKNNAVGTVSDWGKSYCISMEIKMNKWTRQHESIFRVAAVDGNYGHIGQRIPALLTQPNSVDEMIVVTGITTKSGDVGNYHKKIKVPSTKWFHIDIQQKINHEVNTEH